MNTFMYETVIPFVGNDNWYPKNVEYNEMLAANLYNMTQEKFAAEQRIVTIRDILLQYGAHNPSPALGLVGWDPQKDKDICLHQELKDDGIILRFTAHLLM